MKKLLIKILFVVVVVVVVVFLFSYLTHGRVIVENHDRNATVTISKVLDNSASSEDGVVAESSRGGGLSKSLKVGKYNVFVKGNSEASSQIINVRAGKTLRINLKTINAYGVEPVMYGNTELLYINSTLYYLDVSSHAIKSVDQNNNISLVVGGSNIESVKWGRNYAVARTMDGGLKELLGGTFKDISLPENITTESSYSFVVSPKDKLFIVGGGEMYKKDLEGFDNIFSGDENISSILASNDRLAVIYKSEGEGLGTKGDSSLVVMDFGGGIVAKKQIDVHSLSWSKSGEYLAINTVGDSMLLSNSLEEVAPLPEKNTGLYSWFGDESLFYTSGDSIWRYDVGSMKASLIANTPLADLISGMTLSENNDYIYVTTEHENANAIKRISLKGVAVSGDLYKLQSYLPKNTANTSISLVNFGSVKPSLEVTPFLDITPVGPLEEASQELKSSGFDLSKFTLKLR